MRAAIYVRKSTAQDNVPEDARSVVHQDKRCRAFIAQQGWTFLDANVYVDHAVSGAVFDRPGLRCLMDAVERRPRPFDVLVMHAEDRLGRDVVETGYLAKRIIDNGVRIFFADGTERKLESAQDALLMAISNFGAAFERERASARVRDKMFSKVRGGHHTGGRVYGYDAVPVDGHVELRVNASEASVVRRFFELSAQGHGIKRIAGILNADGVRGPKGSGRWSATGIRDMLRNERYRGTLVFGRTTWEVRKGLRRKVQAPEAEWIRLEVPHLRIVSAAVWQATHQRLEQTFSSYRRQRDGRLSGRPERSLVASKYLLSGMLRCGVCSGTLVAIQRKSKSGRLFLYYVCGTHRTRGATACSNGRGLRAGLMHDMIVAAFKRDILTPTRVEQAVHDGLEDHVQWLAQVAGEREDLQKAVRRIAMELQRLATAVAEGAAVQTLLEAIKTRERERDVLQAKLEHLDGLQKASGSWDAGAYGEKVREVLGDWQRLLGASPELARQVLGKLLTSPIFVFPIEAEDGSRYFRFGAKGSYGRALGGIIGISAGVESHLTTLREARVVPGDDLADEIRQLIRERGAVLPENSGWSLSVVPKGGLEPPHPCGHMTLNGGAVMSRHSVFSLASS
jgi:site-specific DNA recombinase